MASGSAPFKGKKKAPVPTTVTVTGPADSFIGDPPVQFTAVVKDQYNAVMTAGFALSWSSSAPANATVDQAGLVTPLTDIAVTITATAI